MKCLTVCQPWAWAIAAGHKLVENRRKRTAHRGPLLIHAGTSRRFLEGESREDWISRYGVAWPDESDLVFSCAVAIVRVSGCVLAAEVDSPWAFGPWCWILEDVQPIDPIPIRGKPGLFNVPDEFIRDPAKWLLGPHVN